MDLKYLNKVKGTVSRILMQTNTLEQAVEIITRTYRLNGTVYFFADQHAQPIAQWFVNQVEYLFSCKLIDNIGNGCFEGLEGVGNKIISNCQLTKNDCFILLSNTGRESAIVEIGLQLNKRNIPLIAVTSVTVSRLLRPTHVSTAKLYELADIIIDNQGTMEAYLAGIEGTDLNVQNIDYTPLSNLLILQQLHLLVDKQILCMS